MNNAIYKNNISRFLLKDLFDQQWVLPNNVPFFLRIFFSFIERIILKPDCSSIRIDRPIFIISLPRSGSSMLQDLLCTHRDVAYINNMMHIYSPYYCGADYLRKSLNLGVEGERFLRDSVSVSGRTPSDPVAVWNRWYKLDPEDLTYEPLQLQSLSTQQITKIKQEIKRILWCFNSMGGARFVSKNPGLMPYISLTSELFPDARFIYLVRDPRNNANSMLKLYQMCEAQRKRLSWAAPKLIPFPRLPELKDLIDNYGPDSIETTSRIWSSSVKFMREWESRDCVHMVRYEDILSHPKETIKSLIDFCELSHDGMDNAQFLEKMGLIGKVKHKNPAYGDYEIIEEVCGAEMKRLGYFS